MADLITLFIVLFIAILTLLRRSSAGLAFIALFAGVVFNDLLGPWVLDMFPYSSDRLSGYVSAVVHLVLTFMPAVVVLVSQKKTRSNLAISLLVALMLGFMSALQGFEVLSTITAAADIYKKSGLFSFVRPYNNVILASGGVLSLLDILTSVGGSAKKSNGKSS